MPNPPKLSAEQRAAALAKATAVRNRRATVKHQVTVGELSVTQVLELSRTDEALAGMKVLSLLEALPRVGKVKARKMMADGAIAESRRLRGLGDHQRAYLESATAT